MEYLFHNAPELGGNIMLLVGTCNMPDHQEHVAGLIKTRINFLFSERFEDNARMPFLNLSDYISSIQRTSFKYVEDTGNYDDHCRKLAQNVTTQALYVVGRRVYWIYPDLVFDHFDKEIDQVVEELSRYHILLLNREYVDEHDLLLHWSNELATDLVTLGNDEFTIATNQIEAELALYSMAEDRLHCLRLEHKAHIHRFKVKAKKSCLINRTPQLAPWERFTTKHILNTCYDTIRAYRLKKDEPNGLEFDIKFSSPSWRASFAKQFEDLIIEWLIIEWLGDKIKDYTARDLKAPATALSKKTKTSQYNIPSFKSFTDLFYDELDINDCVDKLRLIESPVINEDGIWIRGGGGKSIIVSWIEVLELRGKIRTIDRPNLCKLLADYFPGLKISDSTFRKSTEIAKDYHADFLRLIE